MVPDRVKFLITKRLKFNASFIDLSKKKFFRQNCMRNLKYSNFIDFVF